MPAQNIEALIEFTKDEDAHARAMAVAGLAKLDDPRGFAPVVVTLFDPADEVRTVAATALGVFGDERAFEPLVQALDDPCTQVAVNAAWALGHLATSRALDVLLEVAADGSKAYAIRTAAVTALGERAEIDGSDLATDDDKIARLRPVLLELFTATDGELRASAVWTAGHLPRESQTVEACVRMLSDGYEWAVRYAIEALVYFDDPSAAEPISRLTSHQNAEIAELATQALEVLEGKRSLDDL
ncbi:MAG: HEAT repeat domain-containing protein [Coriobacteriaceae bacterium]|nr:HEAT repeat domain-containing protein [Coriobacteriaceae bacterium]